MDVESVAAELYTLRPAEFTAARDEYVARARKAGDKQLAASIAQLRKPAVAAWTAGLLARQQPDEAQHLLDLGEALRSAHRTLDGDQLRKLSRDQHVVISRLARAARTLAAEAGQTVSDPVLHEVEQILHAVLADPDTAAQWATGRLAKTPDPVVAFAGLEPEPDKVPPRGKQKARPTSAAPRQPRPSPGSKADGEAEAAHRKKLVAARAELADAHAETERLETESVASQEMVDRAAAAVAEAEEEVRTAKEHLQKARAASTEAITRRRETGRAATEAKAREDRAARKLEKLTGPGE